MNLLLNIEVAVLIALLCSIAWYVLARQRIGLKRDAASLALMQQSGEAQIESLKHMLDMNKIQIERARREAAEHEEGEGWKES